MSDGQPPSAWVFLNKKEDFERVKRAGVRVTTRVFNMMSCASNRETPRVGIVVGRRFGNAVTRNRGKRIFRALARTTGPRLRRGHDIVIFPKRPALTLSHPALHEAWVTTLTRRGLMASSDSRSCAR